MFNPKLPEDKPAWSVPINMAEKDAEIASLTSELARATELLDKCVKHVPIRLDLWVEAKKFLTEVGK